jgi:hypothetical protein
MLAIPRKTTEDFDMAAPIVAYLAPLGAAGNSVENAMAELRQMRTEATRTPGADASSTAAHADHCYKYFGQLENMKKHTTPRIVVGETGLALAFRWSDAFRPHNFNSQNSIEFQQENVLFNAAAHESMTAASFDRSSIDRLKSACK